MYIINMYMTYAFSYAPFLDRLKMNVITEICMRTCEEIMREIRG